MKHIFCLLVFLMVSVSIRAQIPNRMSYQAIVRDSGNELIRNSNIGMQISIIPDAPDGLAVFVERHFPITNNNGLVSLEIGTGVEVTGKFVDIDWSSGIYFLKSETDLNGGANYTISGTTQILSVPYAMYAKEADKANENDPLFTASPAQGISSPDITNWNTSFGWGDHEGMYSLIDHKHDASDINSGTLDNTRYSAYSDLQSEGRLDNNSSADLLTRSQSDSRYVSTSEYYKPGIDYYQNSSWIVSDTWTDRRTISLTVPASGYVLCTNISIIKCSSGSTAPIWASYNGKWTFGTTNYIKSISTWIEGTNHYEEQQFAISSIFYISSSGTYSFVFSDYTNGRCTSAYENATYCIYFPIRY